MFLFQMPVSAQSETLIFEDTFQDNSAKWKIGFPDAKEDQRAGIGFVDGALEVLQSGKSYYNSASPARTFPANAAYEVEAKFVTPAQLDECGFGIIFRSIGQLDRELVTSLVVTAQGETSRWTVGTYSASDGKNFKRMQFGVFAERPDFTQFTKIRIAAQGNHYSISINGKIVTDFTDDQARLRIRPQGYAGVEISSCPIAEGTRGV